MLQTRFTFNDNVEVEVSADQETAMISMKKKGDEEHEERSITLDEKEIDLMIATLNFYKSQLKKN